MAKSQASATKSSGGNEAEYVTIRVPVATPRPDTYIAEQSGHVDAHLGYSGDATVALRRLHAGLLATAATFADGRPVVSKADVMRWLFQRIASAESATV